MEAIFENECSYSKANLADFQYNMKGRGYRIANLAIPAFALLMSALLFLLNSAHYAIMVLILAVCSGCISLLLPWIVVRSTLRQHRVLYDGVLDTRACFYDDRIVVHGIQSKAENTFQYGQVKRMRKTKLLYLIAAEGGLFILVDRNGFTKGKAEDFEAFIEQKITRKR